MTASPDRYRRGTHGWYDHTDQGIGMSERLDDEATARTRGNEIATELRASMRREGASEAAVRARVAALRVGYGRRDHPWGRFEAI